MTSKLNSILQKVIEEVSVPKEKLKEIEENLIIFLEKVNKELKSKKVQAEVFIGGSFARKTLIKKDHYDIDIFIRFDQKYRDEEISEIVKKILTNIKRKQIIQIHGSRDYFQIRISNDLYFEIIPVKKIKNPKEANNITDLSYSHVRYIKSRIKSEKTLNEIKLAKAFCYANNCYGAESYIKGFSGYSLELLIHHYKSFLKFAKAMTKVNEKLIIDLEKDYKNKSRILLDLNASKIQSPIVLIDPTYKTRNVLAALSKETFRKFQDACKKFLKRPSIKDFELEDTDTKKIEMQAGKNGQEFLLLKIETNRQEGDIAGSKLLKFNNLLKRELENFFEIKNAGFRYSGGKTAESFFSVKKKKEEISLGPEIKDTENAKKFKKKHKKTFTKNGRLCAKKEIRLTAKTFFNQWKKKNSKRAREMSITNIKSLN